MGRHARAGACLFACRRASALNVTAVHCAATRVLQYLAPPPAVECAYSHPLSHTLHAHTRLQQLPRHEAFKHSSRCRTSHQRHINAGQRLQPACDCGKRCARMLTSPFAPAAGQQGGAGTSEVGGGRAVRCMRACVPQTGQTAGPHSEDSPTPRSAPAPGQHSVVSAAGTVRRRLLTEMASRVPLQQVTHKKNRKKKPKLLDSLVVREKGNMPIDYSKFDNIDISDDEDDARPKAPPKPVCLYVCVRVCLLGAGPCKAPRASSLCWSSC